MSLSWLEGGKHLDAALEGLDLSDSSKLAPVE